MSEPTDPTGASYDAVAPAYAREVAGELDGKPFDRALLDRFAARVAGAGLAGDVGCGPGHVAAYLHARGVEVLGVDLSAGMVDEARRLHPDVPFVQGDMRALPVPDGAWAGLVAFYSLIHLPPADIPAALAEFARVLAPGAPALLSFHVGDETLHLEEWWGAPVSLDFHFFQPEAVRDWLTTAGFVVEAVEERAPYAPEVEHQSHRCYVTVRAPGAVPMQA